MKTIIAGSRDITDESIVRQAIKFARTEGIVCTEIVCGKARGVDSVGEALARRYGIPVKEFPADWTGKGKQAGFARNADMADYADALIAIWDGRSPGTRSMIKLAKQRKLKVYVHLVLDSQVEKSQKS